MDLNFETTSADQQRSRESLVDVAMLHERVVHEGVGEEEDDDGDDAHGCTRPSERCGMQWA